MVWGPIIAAGITAATSAFGASRQNRTQIAMSREQMDFQERMSNTAYQRSMADMRAAGLNPMLAYGQGGATTPGGAQPNIVNPMGTELSGITTTALQSRRVKAETDATKQSEDTNFAQMQKYEAEQALVEENLRIASANVWSAKAEAQKAKATIKFYQTETGQRLRHAQLTGESLGVPGALGLLARGVGAFSTDAKARSKSPAYLRKRAGIPIMPPSGKPPRRLRKSRKKSSFRRR